VRLYENSEGKYRGHRFERMQKTMRFQGSVQEVLSLPRDLKLIFSAHLLWTFGEGLYFFILPVYVIELGGTGMEIGFLYSFMFLVYTLSVLLGGFLADRFDRKKLIIYIFMFGSLSSLIYSFATEWWHLIPAMLVYSLATIGGPAEDSYIAALVSKERMARAFTFTEMGYSFGLIFSPLLGAYLLTFWGMKWIFRLSFAFGLLAAFTLFFISPQIPPKKEKSGGAFAGFHASLTNRRFMLWMPLFMTFAFGVTLFSPFVSAMLSGIYRLDESTILVMGSISYAGEAILGMTLGGIGMKGTSSKALCLSLIMVSAGALLFAYSSPFLLIPLAVFLMGGGRVSSALARSIAGTLSEKASAGAMFAIFTVFMGTIQTVAAGIGGILYECLPIQPFLFGGVLTLSVAPLALILEKHFLRHKTTA
jgi:ENTS family enterobactin (siderophore) exporter